MSQSKIVITGGAGLVGQNLIVRLLSSGYRDVHVLDKASHNLGIARKLHPGVTFIEADLSSVGPWQDAVSDADIIVMLHAQIGGNESRDFYNNNVVATENTLRAAPSSAYVVHVSSSVVESAANDEYSRTKAMQEELVVRSGLAYTIFRPTLMFGWFDRKHFGWLSRFMSVSPVFPIPGNGEYVRQPLYAGDFCEIIRACMVRRPDREAYNISGKEKVAYIDIIRSIRRARGSRCVLLKLPYSVFYALLWIYALFDRNPPFTTSQLRALVLDEVFEDIDWEGIFGVEATQLDEAITETFCHPTYSEVRLQF